MTVHDICIEDTYLRVIVDQIEADNIDDALDLAACRHSGGQYDDRLSEAGLEYLDTRIKENGDVVYLP